MKRFAGRCVLVGLVAVMVVTTFSGCVSQGKYNELKFAEQGSQAERSRLAAELAGALNTIRLKDVEINRLKELLANREDVIKGLKDQIAKAGITLDKMTTIYDELAKRGLPTGGTIVLPPALDTALKEFASKYPNLVEYDPARGVLRFKSDILFALGIDEVNPDVIPALQEFAKIMNIPEAGNFDAVVVGHTDNVPISRPATRAKHPTNWHLSVHRSIAVMDVLKTGGIDQTRMGVMGYGEFRPLVANEDSHGNAKNRRVEVYIVPKQAIGERSLRPSGGSTAAPEVPTEGEK